LSIASALSALGGVSVARRRQRCRLAQQEGESGEQRNGHVPVGFRRRTEQVTRQAARTRVALAHEAPVEDD